MGMPKKVYYKCSLKLQFYNNIRMYISMFHSACVHDFIKK
jgi:hypothetical protein